MTKVLNKENKFLKVKEKFKKTIVWSVMMYVAEC